MSEIVKHRANRGSAGDLSYYRDRSGAEVDLVVERPDTAVFVEAKATATPSASLLAAGSADSTPRSLHWTPSSM